MQSRDERLIQALDGLRVGDAFGFKLSIRPAYVAQRLLPEAPWYWSDDTIMAVSVAAMLSHYGDIRQDELFEQFVLRYRFDPRRGYGGGMKKLLGSTPTDGWRTATPALFGGEGSLGNGAAMRAPVIGAYFYEDLERVAEVARKSAQVTHAHREGIAGAVAVACMAAIKCEGVKTAPEEVIQSVADCTPESAVRDAILHSLTCVPGDLEAAAEVLGNGSRITALDTVPLCVWWAAHAPATFEEAMWRLVGVGGDEDTNCAIVGGILGAAGIAPPPSWLAATEAQPPLTLLAPE